MHMAEDVSGAPEEIGSDSVDPTELETSVVSEVAVSSEEEDDEGLNEAVEDDLSLPRVKDQAEIRRDRYHRRTQLKSFLEEIGGSSDEALNALAEIDRLIPDALTFSPGQSLEDRFLRADENMKAFFSPLYVMPNSTIDFDALEDVDRRFKKNATIKKMIETEGGLLKAIIVNDRAQSAYAARLAEHEAAKSFLLKELVRRRSLAESWRYLIPKYLMPFLAAIQVAGISEKVFRPRRKFTVELIDLLMTYANKKATRADIIAAMEQTEDQFAALLSEADDPFGALAGSSLEAADRPDAESSGAISEASQATISDQPSIGQPESEAESFEVMGLRVLQEMAREQEALVSFDDRQTDEIQATKDLIRGYMIAHNIGGGLTRSGNLIFPSVADFIGRLDSARMSRGEAPAEQTTASDEDALAASDDAPEVSVSVGADGSADISDQPAGKLGDDLFEDDTAPKAGAKAKVPSAKVKPSSTPGLAEGAGVEAVKLPEISGVAATDAGADVSVPAAEPAAEPAVKPPAKPAVPASVYSRDLTSNEEHFSTQVVKANEPWPMSRSDKLIAEADMLRSNGFNMSVDSKAPFAGWAYTDARHPFSHMSTRALVVYDESEPELRSVDLSRLEMPSKTYSASIVDGRSHVLGLGHDLMLVPHGMLDWYADQLGWQEVRKRRIAPFGNPMEPSSLRPAGDASLLMEMLRCNADLHLRRLTQERPDGFFDDALRLEEATEDLARWWVFVLIARHDPDMFEPVFGPGFFHGVEAPDFFLNIDAMSVFGPSHIRLSMPKIDALEAGEDPDSAVSSSIYAKNLRRRIPAAG